MTAMTQESGVVGKLFRALGENLNCVFVMTEVGDAPSEPDQVIGACVGLGVFACFGKFGFKLATRLSRKWRRNLLGALQTRLTEY